MKFAIITHVNHFQNTDKYFAYAPYTREMNIWLKYIDEVIIVAPLKNIESTEIDISYKHDKIDFRKVPDFSFINLNNAVLSIFKLPIIFWRIFLAMKKADHIHLRCPGNMGLIGCFVQVLFPNKIKTAKYAGNWDQKSKQPWAYRLQKRILNNTFLTKNMQVLVYGDWENQSKNIRSFFTATYSEREKEIIQKSDFNERIEFIFVGSLVVGKNPLYAIKLVEQFVRKGRNVILNLYGEGVERHVLEQYVQNNQLGNYIFLHGNKNDEILKRAYQKSHFVILPSKSEGWPKAIAEGMFWGCIPVATSVSCIPFMLDYGNRGVLLDMNLSNDILQLESILKDKAGIIDKSMKASEWSRKFTTDIFETEIKKMLQS